MIKNKLVTKIIFLLFLLNLNNQAFSQIMILSGCKTLKDGFVKHEYILNLYKSLMIRNYVYDSKN